MASEIFDFKNSRTKRSLTNTYKIQIMAYHKNFLEYALLLVLKNMLRIHMNSTFSSMIIGRAPMRRYPIRQDPKQVLQNSGRLLRNIRSTNGSVLHIYKIGLQMQF